jgi:flagellar biosynthesis protein FlhB
MSRSGGEPTEAPTPRRLADARRRGQVAFSRDFGGAVALGAVFAVLLGLGPALAAELTSYFDAAFRRAAVAGASYEAAGRSALWAALRVLALPVVAAFAVGMGVNLLQTGGLLSLEPVRPDLTRLSPAASLTRLFGKQAALELVKAVAKIALLAAVGWVVLRSLIPDVVALAGATPPVLLAGLGALSQRVIFWMLLVTVVMGVADYLLVRGSHLRSLRMTRDEVRREYKESEGDPSHRAERQRLHRELLEQRMVEDVRKADFVVVNPDHIAVALRYDQEGQSAPLVVAKGQRLVAERIKQVAREAGVPIFRDVSLARALREVEEGDEIPEALYQAVAEILRVVYEVSSSTKGGPKRDAPARPAGPDVKDGPRDEATERKAAAAIFEGTGGAWKRV